MIAVTIVCSLSLSGALFLIVRPEALRKIVLVLVAFASGGLLGDAFLHLLPEIAETPSGFDLSASLAILGGLIAFFILEKLLHWHHAHMPHEEVMHPVAVTNLVGEGLHNFVDGALVAGGFIVSPEVGIATTVAVALHEIPQELGDFAILIHAGLSSKKALILNFLSSLAAFAGAIATLSFITVGVTERIVLPFTAGTFIYIAATDLIPELHKEPEPAKSLVQLGALLAGIGVMAALLVLE